MTFTADLLFKAQNDLGEGPLWHPKEKCLYWLDIVSGDIYQSNQDISAFKKSHFNTMIGSFGFLEKGGLILATNEGFAYWMPDRSEVDTIWNPLPRRENVRMNDGKVDLMGRFWAGSMDPERQEGELYRLDPDRSQHTLLHHIGISNGIGWSPDQETMYFTDSMQYTIFAFDFDLDSGAITNQRTFIELPKDGREIVPDGLCVDAEGCIWSAHWNGWEIIRYDPKGNPILKVNVPAQRVTSCCFGGENLDQLFITSSRGDLPQKDLGNQPSAGDVFIYQTNTRGQPANFFGK